MAALTGIELLGLVQENPAEATRELRERLAQARVAGDREEVHTCSDLLLPLLVQQRTDLDEAEALGREMVALLPDETHLLLLAQVYELTGKLEEARSLRAQAEVAPQKHLDEIGLAVMEVMFGTNKK